MADPSLEQTTAPRTNLHQQLTRTLSFGQQRLWFMDQLFPNSAAYDVPFVSRLTGQLDAAAVENAFRALVQRHEVLRTIVVPQDGMPIGVLLQDKYFEFKRVDVRGGTNPDAEARAKQLVLQEARRTFELGRGPLFRIMLVQFADDSYLLLHNAPHLAFDGASIALMFEEVAQLYLQARGQHVPLPDLPMQFSDFAVWQQQEVQANYDVRMQYWLGQLRGAVAMPMPYDRPRPAVKSLRGGRYPWRIDGQLLHAATSFFNQSRLSNFRGFYAALNVLLHCYTGFSDILVSSPVASKRPPGAEKLIGLFVNTVVFRSRFSENSTFRELLAIVSKTVKEGVSHAGLEFDRIIAALNPPREATSTPLVQMNFRVRNSPYPALQFSGMQAHRTEYVESDTSKFDLALEIEASEGTAYFEYSSDLYDRTTVADMAEDFQMILRALVANPDTPLKQLRQVVELCRERHCSR